MGKVEKHAVGFPELTLSLLDYREEMIRDKPSVIQREASRLEYNATREPDYLITLSNTSNFRVILQPGLSRDHLHSQAIQHINPS